MKKKYKENPWENCSMESLTGYYHFRIVNTTKSYQSSYVCFLFMLYIYIITIHTYTYLHIQIILITLINQSAFFFFFSFLIKHEHVPVWEQDWSEWWWCDMMIIVFSCLLFFTYAVLFLYCLRLLMSYNKYIAPVWHC